MDRSAGIVLFAVVAAFVGIAYGLYLIQWILKLDEGSDKMKAIARAIPEGANAYLNRGIIASDIDGGLFDDDRALTLDSDALRILANVTKLDWSSIEPSIFGTLFERSLDPGRPLRMPWPR